MLENYGSSVRVAVIGSGGGIGGAFERALAADGNIAQVYGVSRQAIESSGKLRAVRVAAWDEESLMAAAQAIAADGPLDGVIVSIGVLHDGPEFQPEKGLRDLKAASFERAFAANTIVPALAAKHFLPLLPREKPVFFAALSARVGSIADNELGGWYAYRASKAALNMVMRNAAIETARRCPKAVVVSLHPGSVDTPLSAPFHKNMDTSKIFSAEDSASKLLHVLERLNPTDSGKFFAYDGQEIPF